jgi:CheY-like chemotaxis protein
VTAQSEGKGKGAEFTIQLRLAELRTDGADETALDTRTAPAAGDGLRILIIDDNTDAAELLGDTLRALGHSTLIAFDGPRALEIAPQFRPEVALVDLGLPVMDGFDVARALTLLPQTANTVLVAVTGYAQESDRERAREAGFDEHLVKPIDVERLDTWLRQRLATTPSAANVEVPSAEGA